MDSQVSNSSQTSYLYAITRRDLTFPQMAVQASHAIFEAAQHYHDPQVEHPHFCLCTVRDEERLRAAAAKLERLGIRFKAWYEPDKDNQLTAIATEPISGEKRRHMRDFQLLKVPEGEMIRA